MKGVYEKTEIFKLYMDNMLIMFNLKKKILKFCIALDTGI
jgi:hypothetical protein